MSAGTMMAAQTLLGAGLVVPRLLNYIVAIYLIIIGVLGVFGGGQFPLHWSH